MNVSELKDDKFYTVTWGTKPGQEIFGYGKDLRDYFEWFEEYKKKKEQILIWGDKMGLI